jgi:hypothetical protein
MVMVGHEAIGVAKPIVPFVGVLEGVQEVQAVRVILEDRLLLVTSRRNVVDSAGVFDAEGTSHGDRTISGN